MATLENITKVAMSSRGFRFYIVQGEDEDTIQRCIYGEAFILVT